MILSCQNLNEKTSLERVIYIVYYLQTWIVYKIYLNIIAFRFAWEFMKTLQVYKKNQKYIFFDTYQYQIWSDSLRHIHERIWIVSTLLTKLSPFPLVLFNIYFMRMLKVFTLHVLSSGLWCESEAFKSDSHQSLEDIFHLNAYNMMKWYVYVICVCQNQFIL